MAQGDYKTFNQTALALGNAGFNFASDTFATAFLSDTYASVDVTNPTPNISDYTEVTGGTYAAKNLINPTWTLAGTIATFDADNFEGANEWARDPASGPTDIRTAIVYKVAGGDALGVMDLTTDGTTPLSLQAAPIAIQWNSNGITRNTVIA